MGRVLRGPDGTLVKERGRRSPAEVVVGEERVTPGESGRDEGTVEGVD